MAHKIVIFLKLWNFNERKKIYKKVFQFYESGFPPK